MTTSPESLPSDLAVAHAMILAERAARLSAEADRSSGAALIAHLKLQIEKLRRELYGRRSERAARLIDQMELELEELEATDAEQAAAAEAALARTLGAGLPIRRPPARKPFPAYLPRERIFIPAPEICPCCAATAMTRSEAGMKGSRRLGMSSSGMTCIPSESPLRAMAPAHLAPLHEMTENQYSTPTDT